MRLGHLFPTAGDTSTIIVACRKADYSASRVARAVEDVDAMLLNLNVTEPASPEASMMEIELRVSHRNPSSVARSLERYGFEVIGSSSPSLYASAEEAAERVAELLHYINL